MDQGSDALNRDLDRDVSPVDRDVSSGERRAYDEDADRGAGLTAADEAVDTSDPDAIRANIERTRAEMSSTIDQIQDRLAPSNLAEQAKDAVREATIGRVEDMWQSAGDNVEYARQSMFETVRSNPIPAAMVGIGLGWLLMNRRSAPQPRYSGRGSYRGDRWEAYDRGYRAYDESPRYYDRETQYGGQRSYSEARFSEGRYRDDEPGIADRARQTAGNVAGSVAETASDVAGSVRDTASDVAGNVRSTASDVADRARDTASDLAERAQYGAQRVEDRVGTLMSDNPLALGAVALIAGIGVGLALPQTERENEWMGDARDRVVDQAQDVARDAIDRAKSVASDVADQATSSVQEQAKEVAR